jgi:PadR family transcriptional regulator PadR
MTLEKSTAQLRKGTLEYCILLLLSKKDLYAPDIIQELKQVNMIVVEGTLYPLLTRLKNAGHLEYRWEESQQGPPRKYYKLTSSGEQLLNDLDTSWKDLVKAIESIKIKDKSKK